MVNKVQVVTPTGDRPHALELSQRYMSEQDYDGEIVWHIVDDGKEPSEISICDARVSVRVYRLPPVEGNSLPRNMLHLLDRLDDESPVVCWEDDDWYAPGHIESCIESLREADASGCTALRYYSLQHRGWRLMENGQGLSALCQTAFRREALPHMKRAAESCMESGAISVDFVFWQHVASKVMRERDTVVGMKGMPGRRGLGIGHRSSAWTPDPGMETLREWIGDDAALYESI